MTTLIAMNSRGGEWGRPLDSSYRRFALFSTERESLQCLAMVDFDLGAMAFNAPKKSRWNRDFRKFGGRTERTLRVWKKRTRSTVKG